MKEKQSKWFTWPLVIAIAVTMLLSVAASDPSRTVDSGELEALNERIEQAIDEASVSNGVLSTIQDVETLQEEPSTAEAATGPVESTPSEAPAETGASLTAGASEETSLVEEPAATETPEESAGPETSPTGDGSLTEPQNNEQSGFVAGPRVEGYFDTSMIYDGQPHVPTIEIEGYGDVEYRSNRYGNGSYAWTEWSANLNDAAISQAAPGQDFEARGIRQDNGEPETFTIPAGIEKRELTTIVPGYEISAGEPFPNIQVSYEGFVSGEGEEQISSPGVVTTDYHQGAPAGDYTIEVSAGYAANYNVDTGYGTLTVSDSGAYMATLGFGPSIYDGKAHSAVVARNPYNIDLEFRSRTAGKDDWTAWSSAPQGYVDVGSYEYEARIKGTATVTGSCVGGIFPRPISITAASATKAYDGKPLTASGYALALLPGTSATGIPVVSGDIAAITITGSQTEIGNSPNVVSNIIIRKSGADVTANYTITKIDGALKVTSGITASFTTLTYDGQAHTPTIASAEPSSPPLEYRVSSDGGTSFSGWSASLDSVAVMHAGDYLFEGRYTDQPGSAVQCTGKINKYPILVTANSAAKDYDGTPITAGGWTVSTTLVPGDTLTATVKGSQQAAGPANIGYLGYSKNVVSNVVIKNGNDDRTGDYDITTRDGYLFINGDVYNESGIVLYASNSVYDGYTKYPFYINYGDPNRTVEFSYKPSTGNPSAWSTDFNSIGLKDIMGTGIYEWRYRTSDGYSGSTSATISRRPLKIATDSQTFTYDGLQHYLNNGHVASGLIDFHTFVPRSLQQSGKVGPAAGTYVNLTLSAGSLQILDSSGRNVAQNYAVSVLPGTLTILPPVTPVLPNNLIVTLSSAQKTYDGTPLRNRAYTVSGSAYDAGLPSGYYITVDVLGAPVNVRDSFEGNNTADVRVFDAGGKDVSSNYNIEVRTGTLAITPAPLTVNVRNYTIETGDPPPDYQFSYSGFVHGETVSAIIPGSAFCSYTQDSPVGTYDIDISPGSAENYIVPGGKGTLSVALSLEDVMIETMDTAVPYDAREHSLPPASNSRDWPMEYRSSPDNGAAWTDWEALPQEYTETGGYIYEVRFERGYEDDALATCSLTILPLEIVIAPYHITHVYDGLPVSSDGQSPPHGYIQSGGLADGESVSLEADGRSGTDVGTSAYTITGVRIEKEDGSDSTPNYEISYANGSPDGSYTVTPAKLTVTMLDESVTAGDPPPDYLIEYSGFVNGEDILALDSPAYARCDYRQDDPSPASEYAIDGYGASAKNYEIEYVPGTLYVEPLAPSPSETPSEEPTETPTESSTPTPTESPSAVPVESPTDTPAESPTTTPTGSPAATPSAIPTGTPTIHPAESPSATPTGSPAATPSVIPTRTPTIAPAGSSTPTPSSTPMATGSIIPVIPSGTPTIHPAESPSATPTGSQAATASVVPTRTPTIVPAGSSTPTPSGTPMATGSIIPVIPSGTPVVIVPPSDSPSPAPSVIPTVTAPALPTAGAPAIPSGAPTVPQAESTPTSPSETATITASIASFATPTATVSPGPSATPAGSGAVAPVPAGSTSSGPEPSDSASQQPSGNQPEETTQPSGSPAAVYSAAGHTQSGQIAGWALLNLILMIAGAIISLVMLFALLGKQKVSEDKKQRKRRITAGLLAIIMGIAAVIVFFLTENIRGPVAVLDRYTIIMAIIFAIQIILVLAFKTKPVDTE